MKRIQTLLIAFAAFAAVSLGSVEAQAGEGGVCRHSAAFVLANADTLGLEAKTVENIRTKVAATSSKTKELKAAYYSALEKHGEESDQFRQAAKALHRQLKSVKASVEAELSKSQLQTLDQLREQAA